MRKPWLTDGLPAVLESIDSDKALHVSIQSRFSLIEGSKPFGSGLGSADVNSLSPCTVVYQPAGLLPWTLDQVYEVNYKSNCAESQVRKRRENIFSLTQTSLSESYGPPPSSAANTVFLDTFYSKRVLYAPAKDQALPEFLNNIPAYDHSFNTLPICPGNTTPAPPRSQ